MPRRLVLLAVLCGGAGCGSEPSDSGTIGSSLTVIFPNGQEETATADTATYYGPTLAVWDGIDTTYYLRLEAPVPNTGPGANPNLPTLQAGAFLAHRDLRTLPSRRTYLLAASTDLLEGTGFGLIVAGVGLGADSGSVRIERVGGGRVRWVIGARIVNAQQQVVYRIRANILAVHGQGPALRRGD